MAAAGSAAKLRCCSRTHLAKPWRTCVAQRSIQIGPQILDGLDPHTQAQQRWRQVLLPGNAGPPLDGGLDGAKACGVLNELQPGAHRVSGSGIAMHVE